MIDDNEKKEMPITVQIAVGLAIGTLIVVIILFSSKN